MKIIYSRLAIFASASLLIHGQAFSQTYKMTDGLTINTCGGIFYDDGGPGGSDTTDLANNNYIDNKVMTETFCSCNGNPIRFTFTAFKTETGYDSLIAYNGTNALAPKIGGWHGNKFPGTITSSNAGNCITFFFVSDFNNNRLGWAANISCTAGTAPAITASGPTTFCNGGSVTLTASSGTAYTWNTGSTTQSIVAYTSGSYYVAVGTGTCSAGSAPVNVTVNPSPTVTVTGAATICPGTSTSLKASGASSYSWAPASSLTNPNISNPYASPSATTTYSVTGTGVNGCASTATVQVTTKPAPVVVISGDNMLCEGDVTTLSGSGVGSYAWNTGQTTTEIIVSPSVNTTYSLQVTGSNGCSGNGQVTVTVNGLPAVPVITANGTTLTSSSGNSYQWYYNSNIMAAETGQSVTTTQNGIYTVCVTDANGCSSCSQGYNMMVIGIETNILSRKFSVFPNPNFGQFKVTPEELSDEKYSLEILDAFGQTLISEGPTEPIGASGKQFDLQKFGPGIYLLSIKNNNSAFVRKIIVY